jgi:phospholipase/carboxylesterase
VTPDLGFAHVHEPGDDPTGLTLLLLHGTGGDEHDLLPLGRALHPGARLLSPRGRVREHGVANRWFARHAEGVLDTDDLVRRAGELAGFVRAAAGTYGFATERLVAVGFSNGANIAAATLLLGHSVMRGAVLLSPMLPLQPDERPDLAEVGVFIGAGRSDPICPPAHAEALAELLTDAGAAVELRWHDAGHTVTAEEVAAAAMWLGKLRAATAADADASPP